MSTVEISTDTLQADGSFKNPKLKLAVLEDIQKLSKEGDKSNCTSVDNTVQCNLCGHAVKNSQELIEHLELEITKKKLIKPQENPDSPDNGTDSDSIDNATDLGNVLSKTSIKEEYAWGKVELEEIELKVEPEIYSDDDDLNKDSSEAGHIKYTCDKCEKSFTTPYTLERHRKVIHEGDVEKNNICHECGACFPYKSSLVRHTRELHGEGPKLPPPKIFLCNQCGYKASKRVHLKEHQEAIHEGVKHSCNLCDFQANYQSTLRKHQKSKHEGVRYLCDQCEYQTTGQSNLSRHKKTRHPDPDSLNQLQCDPEEEKPVVPCPVCSKTFANVTYMKKHLKRGHGSKEDTSNHVSCDECGKQFSNNSYLDYHKKWVHEVEDATCELCNRTFKNKRALARHARRSCHSGQTKETLSPKVTKHIPTIEAPTHLPSGRGPTQYSTEQMDMSNSQQELSRQHLQHRQMETQAVQW